MFVTPSRTALRALAIIACSVAFAFPVATFADTRSIGALDQLSISARAALPPDTVITFTTGSTATIRQLLAQHEQHARAFANAKSLGANLLLNPKGLFGLATHSPGTGGLHYKTPAVTPSPTNLAIAPGTFGSKATPTPQPTPTALPLVTQSYAGHGYANDYVSFCEAAQASACLYIPGPYYYGVTNSTLIYPDVFEEPQACAENGGQMESFIGSAICVFSYPIENKVGFFAGSPPTAQATGTCQGSDGFGGSIDTEHGNVDVFFQPANGLVGKGYNAATTVSCVVRVIAPE